MQLRYDSLVLIRRPVDFVQTIPLAVFEHVRCRYPCCTYEHISSPDNKVQPELGFYHRHPIPYRLAAYADIPVVTLIVPAVNVFVANAIHVLPFGPDRRNIRLAGIAVF